MNISKITLKDFKKVSEAELDLAPVNILVGGNNSGKSSILEGIHFSVVAAVAARIATTRTFTQDSLLFCPTKHFVNLRHNSEYKNQSNFGFLNIFAHQGDQEINAEIKIYRGRNEGNVGCDVSGSIPLRQHITNSDRPFSIYVPGLSGIPQVEEYRTESIVRRGVASGDANLYLRNVMLLIKQNEKLEELTELMRQVFPSLHLTVQFDQRRDQHIKVNISQHPVGFNSKPIELVGTGIQQALQIFSYIVLFKPALLLLDEPDSHLHPNNQGLLAKAMLAMAESTSTKIIASTHSRHLVDALYDESNIVWLKNGAIFEQGDDIDRIPLLMDLGALDSFEKIRDGQVNWVFLSEDASTDLLKALLLSSGYNEDEFVIYSYRTSSNIQSALLLAEFIGEIANNTQVVVHRDRDFMTPDEVGWTAQKIENVGATAFITSESDIEAYFTSNQHLATLLEVEVQVIETWLNEIATSEHNELHRKFIRKRDDAKQLYNNRGENPPNTRTLAGNNIPLEREKRLGKFMLRKIRTGMHERYGQTIDLVQVSEQLNIQRLREILDGR